MEYIQFIRLSGDHLPGYDLILKCNDRKSSHYGIILIIDFTVILSALASNKYQFTEKQVSDAVGYLKYIKLYVANRYSVSVDIFNIMKYLHIKMLLDRISYPGYSIIDMCCTWFQNHKHLDNDVIDQIRTLIAGYTMYKMKQVTSIISPVLMLMDCSTIIHIFRGLYLGNHPAFYDFLNAYVNDSNKYEIGCFLLMKTSAIRMAIYDQEFKDRYWPAMDLDEVVMASATKTRDGDDNHLSYEVMLLENGDCIINVIDELSTDRHIIYAC